MGLVFSLIIVLLFGGCRQKKELARKEPVYSKSYYVVHRGENLETILKKFILNKLTYEILDCLKNGGFSFRRCIPGDSITIFKKDGKFSKLVYTHSIKDVYYVFKNSDEIFIAMKYPYIDTIPGFIRGEITATLYDAMLAKGETPNLVFRYADAFAWEIDFVTETRKGDSFYLYFNKTFCDSQFLDYDNLIFLRYKGKIGDYYGIYYKDPEGREDYYNLKGQSLRKSLLKAPLRYSYISSYFTERRYHPILKIWRPHHGLDYVAPRGAPVSSIGDGIITFAGWKGGYGKLVEIRHKNSFRTRYGHLSRFARGIRKGKRVKMGQLIGYVGSTGLSTGPHLHFELRKNGRPINPLRVKIPRAPSVCKKYRKNFFQYRDSLLTLIKNLSEEELVSTGR